MSSHLYRCNMLFRGSPKFRISLRMRLDSKCRNQPLDEHWLACLYGRWNENVGDD